MILSLSFQARLFLTTLVWGFGLAFFYDVIRVLRIAVKHNKIAIGLQDIIYWILVSAAIFFVMLSESFGEVRFFCVVGVFLGMIFYFFALSKVFLSLSTVVIHAIKKVVAVVVEIIMTPFRLLGKLVYKPVKKTYKIGNKIYKKTLQSGKICVKIYINRFKRNMRTLHKKKS